MMPLQQQLLEFLDSHQINHKNTLLLLAYSGGLDSSVLLHALSEIKQKGLIESNLLAVYINHGLQSESAAWGEHCRQQAAAQQVPFQLIRIQAEAEPRQSPEAAAREARYAALAECMHNHPHPVLLTAQHQDDQAETLLLQLIRGAGSAGLSAMPVIKPFANGRHARPLLAYSRQQLEDYASAVQLTWVDDPSNADNRYDRNYIRNEVMPLLRQRWPSVGKTIARSAELLGQEHELLQDELADDLLNVGDGSVFYGSKLQDIKKKSLTPLIRLWLLNHQVPMPSQAVMDEIRALLDQASDTLGEVSWGKMPQRVAVRVFQGDLYLIDLQQEARLQQLNRNADRLWELPSDYVIEELDLRLTPAVLVQQGIQLPEHTQSVHLRFGCSGGERLYLEGHSQSKRVKNWFQEKSVPPWLRSYCPLLYVNDKLVAIITIHKL